MFSRVTLENPSREKAFRGLSLEFRGFQGYPWKNLRLVNWSIFRGSSKNLGVYEQNKSFFQGFSRNPRKSSNIHDLNLALIFEGFSRYTLKKSSNFPANLGLENPQNLKKRLASTSKTLEIWGRGRGISRVEASIDHPSFYTFDFHLLPYSYGHRM